MKKHYIITATQINSNHIIYQHKIRLSLNVLFFTIHYVFTIQMKMYENNADYYLIITQFNYIANHFKTHSGQQTNFSFFSVKRVKNCEFT